MQRRTSAPPPYCIKMYFCVLKIGIKAKSDNEQEPSKVMKHDKTRSTLCFHFYLIHSLVMRTKLKLPFLWLLLLLSSSPGSAGSTVTLVPVCLINCCRFTCLSSLVNSSSSCCMSFNETPESHVRRHDESASNRQQQGQNLDFNYFLDFNLSHNITWAPNVVCKHFLAIHCLSDLV